MAVNYFRYAPAKFIELVKELKKDISEFKNDGKICTDLQNLLKSYPGNQAVYFSPEANEACRKNNSNK